MAVDWKLPGWTWLKTTAEVAALTFTLTLYGAWQDAPSPDLLAINWSHVLRYGSYQVVGVILYGVVSLGVHNGLWSRVRSAIATNKIEPKP